MKFLFLIGVEGTGHGMIRAVLEDFLNQPNIIDEGQWHHFMIEYWDVKKRINEGNLFSNPLYRVQLINKLDGIFRTYSIKGVTHLFESTSFPYDQPRETLCRPDVIDFFEMIDKNLIDLRMLVLYRNPISVTYSAIRRGFTKNIILQAKIVEDNFIYIDRQLSVFDKKYYRVLPFEGFIDNPEIYIEGLSDWWGIEKEKLSKGIKRLRETTSINDIPNTERNILENFFTFKRIRQWQVLYSNDNKIQTLGM